MVTLHWVLNKNSRISERLLHHFVKRSSHFFLCLERHLSLFIKMDDFVQTALRASETDRHQLKKFHCKSVNADEGTTTWGDGFMTPELRF